MPSCLRNGTGELFRRNRTTDLVATPLEELLHAGKIKHLEGTIRHLPDRATESKASRFSMKKKVRHEKTSDTMI